MPHYAWIITKDHIADEEYPEGTNMNAKGVIGPFGATETQIELAKKGYKFRILDDDGEVYYKGRLWVDPKYVQGEPVAKNYREWKGFVCSWNVDEEAGFSPLNDFATPNAGATEIQYRCLDSDGNAVWAIL